MTKAKSQKVCASCLYWSEPECRRHAPRPEDGRNALWPSTHPNDWCGEWVPYTSDPYAY